MFQRYQFVSFVDEFICNMIIRLFQIMLLYVLYNGEASDSLAVKTKVMYESRPPRSYLGMSSEPHS